MTIDYKFAIGDRVLLLEINQPGYVVGLKTDRYGSATLVTYWNDGKRNEEWVFDPELEAT